MKKKPITVPRGRDSRNGQFIRIAEAKRRPSTTEIEKVPIPGKGIKNR
jgi:hypothetical protein